MKPKPHDALALGVLSRLEIAAPYLESVLPSELREAIDLTTLELLPSGFHDPDLSYRQVDVLYRAKLRSGRACLLYVLVEHQSSVEQRMALRLLVYAGRILDVWRREYGDAEEVPALIPVVLYSGQRAWTAPTDLHSLLDLEAPARRVAEHFSPQLRYVVDDLARQNDAQLESRPGPALIRLTLLLLRHGHDELPALLAFLRQVAALFNALKAPDDWRLTITYILSISEASSAQVLEALEPALGQDALESAVTAAEQLRVEGILEGERRVLLRMLRQKFGGLDPDLEKRIAAAELADLERWTRRFVEAETLDSIFA